MAAIPPALAVERDDELVRALQRLQKLGRPRRCEDRIAERPGQLVEHARPSEEAKVVRRKLRQELGPQEVDDERIVARERPDLSGSDPGCCCRQRGEVQPGWPALCAPDQLGYGLV